MINEAKIWTLACLILVGVSCSKDSRAAFERDLDLKNLTPCSSGGCSYVYSEWGDLVGGSDQLTIGKFRMFFFETDLGGTSTRMYVKAPMEGVAFKLDKADLNNGRVELFTICRGCRLAPLSVIDGTVRGQKLVGDDTNTPETWVIEADVNIGSVGNNRTVHVKQVFYPDFVRPDLN